MESEKASPDHVAAIGALAELGIEKGQPFSPDVRESRILTEAAEVAHQEMSVSLFANRRGERTVWEDRQWEWLPVAPFREPLGAFGSAEVRQFFWFGWGTSAAIGRREVGAGSIYFGGFKDQAGAYLNGGKSYQLNVPGPVPADLFWSVTIYDTETRCLIETDLGRAAVRSHLDSPQVNPDGSYDVEASGHREPIGNEKRENGATTLWKIFLVKSLGGVYRVYTGVSETVG